MTASVAVNQIGYGQLVSDGHYADAPSGLRGKYDNVRRFWENQITRFAVRPAVSRLIDGVVNSNRGLRIADLGCGSGEGWDLLSKLPMGPRAQRKRYLIGSKQIDAYHGIDLCPEMVEEARQRFTDVPQVTFAQGDLNKLADHLKSHQAFDLYYNSYGSLSHLDDESLRKALSAILNHQPDKCAVVVDVHGQYSPEWPCYWGYSAKSGAAKMKPYNMVWMYPPSEREQRLIEQRDYRIRYWGGAELRRFLLAIPELRERLHKLTLVDRSVLVGRHMDTTCFSSSARPLRREVNSLFEFNHGASPTCLYATPLPVSGNSEIDYFFSDYLGAWNALVVWFARLLNGKPVDSAALCAENGPVPSAMLDGMQALEEQAQRITWCDPGDPEVNLVQPQFGLLLRQLEFHMQRGLGCGHGLLAIVELDLDKERG